MRGIRLAPVLILLFPLLLRAAPAPIEASDWSEFESATLRLRAEDRRLGYSYLISGFLVTAGGLAGASSTGDSSSKFVFGLAQGLGVAAVGYGVARLSNGGEHDSFFEAVSRSGLSPGQKDRITREYLEREREKRGTLRKINLYTHLVIGTLQLASATQEKDPAAKTFFQAFAGLNFALAFAYAF